MKRLVGVGFFLALCLQTYLLYFFPTGHDGELFFGADKVVHASMFGGPALLAVIMKRGWFVVALALYAPVSEVIQAHVGRDGDVWDAVADLTGILVLGVGFGSWVRSRMA